MMKLIRTVLVILFCAALVGASVLFFYTRTTEDNTPPEFHIDTDPIEISVTDPASSLMQGLTATDNRDGDLTQEIRIRSHSSFIRDAEFTVSYIVFDQASNYSTCSRRARYTDYVPPRFRLTRPMTFNVNETIRFDGSVIVEDLLEGDISGRLKLEKSTVVNSIPGTYQVVLSAANQMGDTVTLPLSIQIVDNSRTRARITLREYLVYASAGQEPDYSQFLSSVTDPMEKDQDATISLSSVTINDSNVRLSTPGTYEVYYYYTGVSGEIATAILTVVVE